jgi:pimeloyl-ACP methyl ester carboxylesterase
MDNIQESQENQKKSKNLHKPPLVLVFYRLIFKYLGAIFPSLIGSWAYHLWFQSHRVRRIPQREQDWQCSASLVDAVNISCDSIEMKPLPVMTYYWENTDQRAPLVMLVHGWTGRGSQMGALAQALQKSGFRVLAFDNHAHGKTAGKSTTIFKQSDVQLALNEKFGPIYAVVAHSFGGMVTSYSLSQGMRTQKVVCLSPPARFDFLLERFTQSLRMHDKVRDYMLTRFKNEYGEDLQKRVSATTTSQQLGHIPTLIIHDEDDQDVPISESELLHQAWPNSTLQSTKGLGHRRILYDDQVIVNIVNFLK